MIINLTSKQRRMAAFVAGVCTSLVFAVVYAQVAQAQVVDFVSFQLEKKLSDPYPTGLEADQFTFDVIGTTASGTPVSFSDIPLTEFTADSANGSVNLQAGTYTITENGPVDFIPGEWTVQWSGAGCDNQSGDSTTITIDVDDLGKENFGCRADNQWRHGNLRVVKDVVGTTTAPENFEFTVTQGNTVRFDGPFNAQGDMEVVIAMGDYEVVEDAYAGFTTTYENCSGTIAQGGSETCTITNTWNGGNGNGGNGTLTVNKVIVGTTTASADDFNFLINGASSTAFELDGSNSLTLPVGIYDITEVQVSGFTTTYAGCEDIVLTASNSPVCTITNTATTTGGNGGNGGHTGTIIIEKQTNPDGNPTLFTFNPSWSAVDFTLADGGQYNSGALATGTYSIVEAPLSGWTQTSAICSDGSPIAAISLQGGETITCVFTNTASNGGNGGNGDDDDDDNGGGGGGNGKRIELTSGGGNGDDDDDDTAGAPAPQVLGESTDIPLGAPGTGHGGASRSASDLQALAILSVRRGVKAPHAA